MKDLQTSQLRFKLFSQSKRTLTRVLILAVLVLAVLPFWTSLQDLLTRYIMKIELYKSIQNVIVPYELGIVGTLLTVLGLPVRIGNAYIEWTKTSGGSEVVYLAWNCIGWQSLVLFVITLLTGLSGRHTLTSKLETLAVGVLGTYLVNIFRLVLVIVVYFSVGRSFGIIFHDYFSNLLTLGWLFIFWWFSYRYVLEQRETVEDRR
ncbi:hypothetical protein A2V56_01995 [Candidatus Woesebacteria bacterium RBG_19FT_COMBO_42_9]|uniref:Exosortase/archaeosortase family protein n=1 Tax=Candidatus Woesebacteria bacterium RBG_16_42_24 TaxID=1802485 RepID=A0A1F7XMP8_9BACT|nr:MAG: hypothetical protein A2V97_02560 [Candidatus Woesebacteria bacterium RBG_16_42_24]OGM17084.1 MAG: hypothetical protein A2V56_01995 [Candidatus Woesebacteria bacterium RBG_19FT_COMBO_42_9]OGM67268.1 MAG: hypothetical protein A2985_02260 [Candidatus Woesebacteria bacterium RIFCSPLOWO2_01_FULL_43_11]